MSSPVQSDTAADAGWSWLDEFWRLPVFRFWSADVTDFEPSAIPNPVSAVASPVCPVKPLPPVDDPQALAFESGVGSDAVVDIRGMIPPVARALARFERVVASRGGTITLKSAFRPSPYQQHLQAVWDKWMRELRDNRDEGCQALRQSVADEFTRHCLLETQRPVAFSDHTRGVGFDAALVLPRISARRRRRTDIDTLARLAGFRRPDVLHDPVHFRYVAVNGL